jgi:hypothetical protein
MLSKTRYNRVCYNKALHLYLTINEQVVSCNEKLACSGCCHCCNCSEIELTVIALW